MHHTRVLRPAEGVYAFYDGRIEGYRFAEQRNWVDEGALSVGIASYAIVSGEEALVYDTHTSLEHARFVRSTLEAQGARQLTVVLSHWHLDHVAGTEVFRDCELTVGEVQVQLIHTNIHSDDATVLWHPAEGLLLCGDTMEDTVTYVDEPQSFEAHLENLERLRQLGADRILPNHGDPDVIESGGYESGLITATERYIRALQRSREEPSLREMPLSELMEDSLRAEWIKSYPAYEAVHRENLATVLAQ